MKTGIRDEHVGIVLIIFAAILWSTAGAFVKLIDMDALTLSATRSVFAALVLLPFLRPKQICWNRYLPILVLLYAITCASYVAGLRYTNATNAVALHFTSPLWIYAWSLIRGRKIRRQELLPMLFIITGIIICIMEPKAGTSQIGNLTALLSGISFAAFAICLMKNNSKNNVGVICLANLFSVPFLYFLAPVNVGVVLSTITINTWIAIAALGSLQLALAYCLFAKGVTKIGAQKSTIIGLLEMILNPIWVLIFAGEIPSLFGIICWCLILAGLTFDTIYNKPNHESQLAAKTS